MGCGSSVAPSRSKLLADVDSDLVERGRAQAGATSSQAQKAAGRTVAEGEHCIPRTAACITPCSVDGISDRRLQHSKACIRYYVTFFDDYHTARCLCIHENAVTAIGSAAPSQISLLPCITARLAQDHRHSRLRTRRKARLAAAVTGSCHCRALSLSSVRTLWASSARSFAYSTS